MMETVNYDALCWGLGIVIFLLMLMADMGMSGYWKHVEKHGRSRRPPTHPPGYKNIKRK